MKIIDLIQDLQGLIKDGREDIFFFNDSEGNNVFYAPMFHCYKENTKAVVLSPDEQTGTTMEEVLNL